MEWENLASLLSLGVGGVAAILLLLGWVPRKAIVEVERQFHVLANKPIICAIFLAALSLVISLLIAVHNGIPQPLIHDEFSYLLAADTFTHGRLTNPTLPFWEHFETPQQLMVPTYMSKYPPGQGIALAIGQVLTGKPIVGAWLSAAAATLGLYWMLLGFVPRNWALLGGLLAALHPELADWGRMYWGGCVAVLGGALLVGAWGRLMITHSKAASVALSLGLIILANTRPFEGLLVALPLLLALLFHRSNQCARMIIPAGLPLMLAGVLMAYYNFRITGHALRLPFVEYTAQYDLYPKFWFLPMRSMPHYRNPAMEYVHRYFELGSYEGIHTLRGFWDISAYRLHQLFDTNLKLAVLLLPLIVSLFGKKERRLLWLMATAGTFVPALWAENFVYPHYQAPLLPVIVLMIVIGWRKLNGWNAIGKAIAGAVLIGFVVGAMMAAAQPFYRDRDMLDQKSTAELFPQLANDRHLIFVSYGPMHSYHAELVHNLANLDESRIIWARSLGREADQAVARHFANRKIWSLSVGGNVGLTPYVE